MFAEAHKEDKGRKMATSVKTKEANSGVSTKYWRIENRASELGQCWLLRA